MLLASIFALVFGPPFGPSPWMWIFAGYVLPCLLNTMVTSRGAHLLPSVSMPYDDSQKTETQCPVLTACLIEDFPGSGHHAWGRMNLRWHHMVNASPH